MKMVRSANQPMDQNSAARSKGCSACFRLLLLITCGVNLLVACALFAKTVLNPTLGQHTIWLPPYSLALAERWVRKTMAKTSDDKEQRIDGKSKKWEMWAKKAAKRAVNAARNDWLLRKKEVKKNTTEWQQRKWRREARRKAANEEDEANNSRWKWKRKETRRQKRIEKRRRKEEKWQKQAQKRMDSSVQWKRKMARARRKAQRAAKHLIGTIMNNT